MTVRINETNTPRGRVASYVWGPDVGSGYGEKPRGVGGVLDGRSIATEARRVSGRAEPAKQYASHQKAGGVGGLCLVLDGASTNPNYPDNNNSYPDATDDDYFPLMDRMGNVTGYRKAAANEAVDSLSAVYEYDAFGQEIRSVGPASDKQPYRFSTKFTEGSTGLVYYGYRWYDAGKGRWINRDPIGEEGGLNLYGMVGNDAVGFYDVLGLFKPPGHLISTAIGLKKSGLNDDCIALITKANNDQDDGAVSGFFSRKGPFFDPLNHGDDNLIAETIEKMNKRLDDALKLTGDCGCEILMEFGRSLHSIQDLYAHSNWIEIEDGKLGGKAKPGDIPVWDMGTTGNPNVPAGIETGAYSYPRDDAPGPKTHKKMNKDDESSQSGKVVNAAGVSGYDLAKDVATRATEKAWSDFYRRLSADQKKKIEDCCSKLKIKNEEAKKAQQLRGVAGPR